MWKERGKPNSQQLPSQARGRGLRHARLRRGLTPSLSCRPQGCHKTQWHRGKGTGTSWLLAGTAGPAPASRAVPWLCGGASVGGGSGHTRAARGSSLSWQGGAGSCSHSPQLAQQVPPGHVPVLSALLLLALWLFLLVCHPSFPPIMRLGRAAVGSAGGLGAHQELSPAGMGAGVWRSHRDP